MKKILIIAILTVLTVHTVSSQNYVDILNIKYVLHPKNEISNKNIKDISLSEFNADLTLPIQFKNDNILITGFYFNYFEMKSGADSLFNTKLYSLELPLGFVYNWKNPKWTSVFQIIPKLNSDLKNIEKNHFQFGAFTILMFDWKENITLQLGIYYNGEAYGSPYITPLVGMDWNTGEKSHFSFLIPSYVRFEYQLSEKFYIGPEFEFFAETYRFGNTAYPNSYINLFGENKMSSVKKLKVFVNYYLTKNLVIYAKTGYQISLLYDQYDSSDNKILIPERTEGELKNNFFAEFGLAFRVRFEDE